MQSQQLATLAGIPMDQVREFVRQYIEMSLVDNSIALTVLGIVVVLAFIITVRGLSSGRFKKFDADFHAGVLLFGIICGIGFGFTFWERYKIEHYPIPYIIQDLRDSKK